MSSKVELPTTVKSPDTSRVPSILVLSRLVIPSISAFPLTSREPASTSPLNVPVVVSITVAIMSAGFLPIYGILCYLHYTHSRTDLISYRRRNLYYVCCFYNYFITRHNL